MNPALRIREPAVAGMFYPANPTELRRSVESYLAEAENGPQVAVKAVIAPHAGYPYSGPIAGSAYVHLRRVAGTVKRVVLLGPSHRVAFRGLASCSAQVFRTPLGDVPVDPEFLRDAVKLPHVQLLDHAHSQEHALEVQLPFLQATLSGFSIVPLVFGQTTPEATSEVLDALWGGGETVVVVSSDLSHYHTHAEACRLDKATATAIEELKPEDIHEDQACGRIAVNALLLCAKKRGLHAQTVDLRNSGDTAGPRHQVVGYGAFLFN